MDKDTLPPRDRAYLDLLSRGFEFVRNSAFAGQTKLCYIEADHLHNIPSLLGETNENRHPFYITKERGLYLARLRDFGVPDYLEVAPIMYSEPWWTLANAAGVSLAE